MVHIPWILIAVMIALITLAILFVMIVLVKKKRHYPGYYSFFITGIIWLAIGIPLKNYALSAMGLIFAVVGLLNKDKWKKNRKTFGDMGKTTKIIMIITISLLLVLALAGFVVLFLFSK